MVHCRRSGSVDEDTVPLRGVASAGHHEATATGAMSCRARVVFGLVCLELRDERTITIMCTCTPYLVVLLTIVRCIS